MKPKLGPMGEGLIVALPFAWALHWILSRLEPVQLHDSFAYLWNGPLSPAFFAGRAITVRSLYWLCGNAPRVIAVVQLAVALGVAVGAHLLLRDPARPRANWALAAAIALAATSFNYSLICLALGSDPALLSLVTLFPCALVLASERMRPWLALGLGVPLIFAHNVAPAIVLAMLLAYAAARVRRRPKQGWGPSARRQLVALGTLAAIAVAASLATQRWDTSVGLNAANNVFARVLPDARSTQHFHEAHGMPVGDFLDQLRGRNVLAQLDGQPIFRANPRTQNYELLSDAHGFLGWVEQRGFREYWKHRLLHEPVGTFGELRGALTESFGPSTVAFWSVHVHSHAVDRVVAAKNEAALRGEPLPGPEAFDEAFYLNANPDVAAAVQRGELPSGRAHYELFGRKEGRLPDRLGKAGGAPSPPPAGLLGFDPVAQGCRVFRALGCGRIEVLLAVAIACLWLARRRPQGRIAALALVLLSGGLAGFAVGYLADALDIVRHVWAPTVIITLGVTAAAAALVDATRDASRSAARPNQE